MIRQPAVADRFYPGSKDDLTRTVRELLPSRPGETRTKAIAVVSPHAGYVYSGAVAAETLSAIQIPRKVVILGLNHHGRGAPVALSQATWDMPMGQVPVDNILSELLLAGDSPLVQDDVAHRFEHSVEVQVPFLQALRPDLTIVPIVLSHVSYQICEDIGATLAKAIQTDSEEILIVASSDMTHYESRESATLKDKQALNQIEQLNPQGLYDVVHARRISMCGVIPVTVALIAAKALGATSATVVRYTDSGEVSGDTGQVVGYAGVVIS
jgi:AmmeMemoRadiSam system protein B